MNYSLDEKSTGTLQSQSPFPFQCRKDLPCFTQCCRDVNIFLTPYDVLRLRRSLGLSARELLERHTHHYLAGPSHIPVVQLLMDPRTLSCTLVTDQGCRVYQDRPWACRMYPLDLTPRQGEYRLIVGKDRCLGLRERAVRSAGEWLEGQGVKEYLEMEEAFQRVIPPGTEPGRTMEPGLGRLLFLAYDLDRFAGLLGDEKLQRFYELDPSTLEAVLRDDEALLRLAFRYIRSQMEELSALL
ncbi:MAG TPA: YkgJ family cysteine cluster protein [Syntrophobacteraceae bacterium]|nr:YkgJ family cysteine cluster protein [Syntrophobacteraceae bacterium]